MISSSTLISRISNSERCPICQRVKKVCQCVAVGGMALLAPFGHDHGHDPDRAPGQPYGKFELLLTSSSSASSTTGSSINWTPATSLYLQKAMLDWSLGGASIATQPRKAATISSSLA
jgi:hypothetical protein